MLKCKNADRYMAKHFPRCNGGDPCGVCIEKWNHRHEIYGRSPTLDALDVLRVYNKMQKEYFHYNSREMG